MASGAQKHDITMYGTVQSLNELAKETGTQLGILDGVKRVDEELLANIKTREEFFEVTGFRFSKRVFPAKDAHKEWNYTTHTSQKEVPDAGLGVTRFHKGFQRRGADKIAPYAERQRQEASRAGRASAHATRRAKHLETLDKRNGFNVISGSFDPTCNPSAKAGRRHFREGLSDLQKKESGIALRVSDAKFYRTPDEAPTPAMRKKMINTEGLSTTMRKSALLGVGRADIPSYGVRDAFDRSIYERPRGMDSHRPAVPEVDTRSKPSSTGSRRPGRNGTPPLIPLSSRVMGLDSDTARAPPPMPAATKAQREAFELRSSAISGGGSTRRSGAQTGRSTARPLAPGVTSHRSYATPSHDAQRIHWEKQARADAAEIAAVRALR